MKNFLLYSILIMLNAGLFAQRPGDLNTDFGEDGIFLEDWPDTTTIAQDIGVLSDGNIIIGGSYYGIDEGNGFLLKIDEQGKLLPFGNFPRGYELGLVDGENIKDVYILPGDTILVAGNLFNETYFQPFVLKLLPNGQPDEEFGEQGVYTDESVQMDVCDMDIYIHENSYKIVLCGNNPDPYPMLLMIDNTGVSETSFGTDGIVEFNDHRARIPDLVVNSENNYLFACGYAQEGSGTVILKYILPNGTPDIDFGEDGILIDTASEGYNAQTFAATIDIKNNTLTVFGKYEHADGDFDMFAYRMNANDGAADASFGFAGWSSLRSPVSSEVITTAILQSDGKYYFGGSSDLNGNLDFLVGRINHNGFGDTTFGTNGLVLISLENTEYVSGLALNPTEDRLYVAGNVEGEFSIMVAAFYTVYETEAAALQGYRINNPWIVFPNPSPGQVTIETGVNAPQKVQVFDLTGKELINNTYTDKNITINLEQLQPSVYIVKISLPDKQAITLKLIKQ